MKAQYRFGISLSWPRVTAVFLIDAAMLVAAGRLPDSWQPAAWWTGVGVAAVVVLLGLITYRGVTMPSALAGWLADWSAGPAALTTADTPAANHQRRYGHEAVGVREHDGHSVAVVAVDEPDTAPAGRHLRRDAPPAALSVAAVAAHLRQFDVRLDGIDIVSVGTKGSRAGIDPRSTWLVLRMDSQHNVGAVAARDSVASTLAAVAERLAQDLAGRRCTAWPMTADELAEVDQAALAGLQPVRRGPGWRRLKHADGYVTSFWISPSDITSETLDQLWLVDADATVLTVALTPHRVSAWVRYHSAEPLPKTAWAGLNPLTGRQLAAVRAGLPTPVARPPLAVPARELPDDDELAVPLVPVRSTPVQLGPRQAADGAAPGPRSAPGSAHRVPVKSAQVKSSQTAGTG